MNKRVEIFRTQIGQDKWLFDYPLMDWMNAKVLEVNEGTVKMQFTVEKIGRASCRERVSSPV